jgi:hypothetical protein
MSPRLLQIASWLRPTRSTLSPYRHALIQTDLKRVEFGLSCLLWVCVTLISGLVWQQSNHLFDLGGSSIVRRPPQQLRQTERQLLPKEIEASEPMVNRQALPSLFHFEHVTVAQTTAKRVPAPEMLIPPAEKVPSYPSHLTVQVQATPSLATGVRTQLNLATEQLRSGQLFIARQSFEQVLQQDPHQVVALAGMLVITSQQGDIQQREDYLSRMRQEIPDYIPDDDLFLMLLED